MEKGRFEYRKATKEDIVRIQEIYAFAREQMRKTGNPNQWGDNKPPLETIMSDIKNGNLILICNPDICGVFSFTIGLEKTYSIIENGKWLNDDKYGVIHKVASAGNNCGIMEAVLFYCEKKIGNIRIDTHNDNKIMQHILEKNGYVKCGRIYVEDGSPRIAYQKVN
ncbi:hypothetical protein SAMN05216249_10420 [Acetitomaculum ruminis DSM 5522]|uniref:N-acetyltransferase domain-containing protein n=1 Tax=Acetitomaculum ruminis DSM 5522 TaxID=1120918 RepID=A0A1I0WDK7_9FIRM|nr:N-acetyltransferase [Acetitomaculum ruminis]SFA86839.1 hypothetical protein SAMN05216249_10420 [Acetitomaculum ruminis DSM 5522]